MSHLRTAFSHLRRSPYQTLAGVLIMSLTFFVATIFVLLTDISLEALKFFETRPQVTAFLEDTVKPQEAESLKRKIESLDDVREVKYISKEEALAIYREENKNDPLLLEMVTANILPASLEVSTTSLASLETVAQNLKNQKGIEEVVFQEDIIRALSNLTTAIKKSGVVLLSFLSLVSVLIILVIIGMKIGLRREEIEILGLIGATKLYISWPFILEGMTYGALGALTGWLAGYGLLVYAAPFLTSFLSGIPVFPIAPTVMFAILGGEILAGLFLGTAGSFFAVRHYFRK